MKKLLLCAPAIVLYTAVFAQQQTNRINQLIAAENYFAAQVKEKGVTKAFKTVSDANTIIFNPSPVQIQKILKEEADTTKNLSWEPVYARMAKSGDWGFTSGPFVYNADDPSKAVYGDYLSVWKKNVKGVWKLALELGVPHPKPTKEPKLHFQNAPEGWFMHQRSEARLQQREDIIFSTDRLFSTTLSADNKIALDEFLADDYRLLFQDQEPIIGKKDALAFFEKQKLKLTARPTNADRAWSGDLAYTYGEATFERNGKSSKYHYVRIWEVQTGHIWKAIFDVYKPVEE